MKIRAFLMLVLVWVLSLLAVNACAGTITLATATSFAVLGGAGVTAGGIGATVISGSIGDYPDFLSSVTGFPAPGTVENGSLYAADQGLAIAQQAQADEITAYNALTGLASSGNLTGIVLGTVGAGATPGYSTLLPGVYTYSSSAQVDGALTLNFNGESNAEFVFQIGTTLTTGSSASIVVEGGNATDSIFWQVGTSATLGSSTSFVGNILALDSITLDPFASVACGRVLADTGSVTLASTNFISANCNADNAPSGFSAGGPSDYGSNGFSGASSSTPEPGAFLTLGFGLTGLVLMKRSASKGQIMKAGGAPLVTRSSPSSTLRTAP
jgi:type VI secretion system secreted protein VgrG